MRKSLQILLTLFGITVIGISLAHIILGPSAIPGSVPVNATMDSEDRFYATMFMTYGIALLWCVRGIEHKSKLVYFLMLMFFVGGLARIVSFFVVGAPDTFFIAMAALELVLPFVYCYLQSKISATVTS